MNAHSLISVLVPLSGLFVALTVTAACADDGKLADEKPAGESVPAAEKAPAAETAHAASDSGALSNPTLTTIFERKSVRHFKDGQVTREQLEVIVRAGMVAPTAMDKHPRHFVVITDRKTLDALAQELPAAKMAAQAQAAIVVVGDLEAQAGGKEREFWITDCSASTQNILLAVESMGLGAVWTAVYPDPKRIDPVKRVLNLPEGMQPLNFIPIGIPTGEDKPKNKWDSSRLHWEKW